MKRLLTLSLLVLPLLAAGADDSRWKFEER